MVRSLIDCKIFVECSEIVENKFFKILEECDKCGRMKIKFKWKYIHKCEMNKDQMQMTRRLT